MKFRSEYLILKIFLISTIWGQSPQFMNAYNKTNEYKAKGDYTSAIQWAEKAVEIAELEFDQQNENYAIALDNLAGLYTAVSRFEEAESLFERARIITENTLGMEHPSYADLLNNIALLYEAMGRYEKAEPLLIKAMTIRKNALGELHPYYALSLNNLAAFHYKIGQYAEAEPLFDKALIIRRKVFGNEHPDVAESLTNLAGLYTTIGRYKDAEPLYKESMIIIKATLGENHPDLVYVLNGLAVVYYSMGQYDNAIILFKQAAAKISSIYGEENSHYAHAISNLGGMYKNMGRYEEAEPLLQKAIVIRENTIGNSHPHYAESIGTLAELFKATGRYHEAKPLYIEQMDIIKRNFGEDHHSFAVALNNLAALYFKMGLYAEAESLYSKAAKIDKKVWGENHQKYATVLANLAVLYAAMGRTKKAEEYNGKVLAINKVVYGEENIHYAISLNNMAELLKSMRRYKEAETIYLQANAIFEKSWGSDHLEYASFINNLAELYTRMGDYSEALSLFDKAIAIFRKTLYSGYPEYAVSISNKASLLQSMERFDEADSLFNQANSILQETLGKNHPQLATSMCNYALFCQTIQNYEKAELLYDWVNRNIHNQIQFYFPGMSERERGEFYNTLRYRIGIFNSFLVKRISQNPMICADAYNNQLAVKALLLGHSTKIKKRSQSSNDSELTDLYKLWLRQREYLANVYLLSQADIAKRGIPIDSLENHLNDLEKELSRRSELCATAFDSTLYTWRDIHRTLKSNEAAVEIVRFNWYNEAWTDTVYYAALIVTKKSMDYPNMVIFKNGNDLEGKHFQDYLKSRDGRKSPIAYKHFWQLIQKELSGISKVYLSPDGIYNKINLNIIYNPDTGNYLLDDIDIHLVTNTKDILLFDENRESNKIAHLFGRPTYNLDLDQHISAVNLFDSTRNVMWLSDQEIIARKRATFSDLPGTEEEIKSIASVLSDNGWNTRLRLGAEALEEAVKAVNNPRILHIATHGFFIEDDTDGPYNKRNVSLISIKQTNQMQPARTDPMLRSGLVLAGAESYLNAKEKYQTEDGILTAYEAANLDLDNTELVVLSACETGLGEVQNGEGVYGLQRAFKVAGAKTILMSLWKVADEATQELMTTFYEKWLTTRDKRAAFRDAQQEMREKYKQPEYWGAFVMVGE